MVGVRRTRRENHLLTTTGGATGETASSLLDYYYYAPPFKITDYLLFYTFGAGETLIFDNTSRITL